MKVGVLIPNPDIEAHPFELLAAETFRVEMVKVTDERVVAIVGQFADILKQEKATGMEAFNAALLLATHVTNKLFTAEFVAHFPREIGEHMRNGAVRFFADTMRMGTRK